MKALIYPLIGWLMSGSGCDDHPIRTSAGKLTQAQVDEVVAKCGGPAGMATVDAGRVSKSEALTAVHHRKVGNHY